MKKILLFAMASLTTSAALATHVYRTENCVSSAIRLEYLGNYAVGGNYSISDRGQVAGVGLVAVENDNNLYTEEDYRTADVIFDVVSEAVVKSGAPINDGCYDTTEGKTEKMIRIVKISSLASSKLRLSLNQTLNMSCNISESVPNEKSCE